MGLAAQRVKEEGYLIHKKTKRVVLASANVSPKTDYESYTPPPFLRKVSGPNTGKIFPWSYHMCLMREMVPYYGEKDEIPTGDKVPGKVVATNEILPVTDHDPDELEDGEKSSQTSSEDNPGILDKIAKDKGTDRITEITNMILSLPKEAFGGKGLPKLQVLREKLDESVTLPELQEAWKRIKELELK